MTTKVDAINSYHMLTIHSVGPPTETVVRVAEKRRDVGQRGTQSPSRIILGICS